jgi:hypothetical protein
MKQSETSHYLMDLNFMSICVIAHSIIHANHDFFFEIEDISNKFQICQIRETFEYKISP